MLPSHEILSVAFLIEKQIKTLLDSLTTHNIQQNTPKAYHNHFFEQKTLNPRALIYVVRSLGLSLYTEYRVTRQELPNQKRSFLYQRVSPFVECLPDKTPVTTEENKNT